MKILIDKQKQLNYHPLVVYFMLKPNDYKKHAKNLELLNKYSGFTRGIFKFRAIARGNEYSHDLTEELTATINRFNVIVRLIDDGDGNYNYALYKMNLNQSPDQFECGLQEFIVSVCKQNIKNLKVLSNYYVGDTEESVENSTMVTSMAQGFKNAINLKGFKHGVWQQIVEPWAVPLSLFSVAEHSPACPADSNCQLPPEIAGLKDSLYNTLPSRKAKDDFKKMMQFFENNMDAPDFKESDMYVQGTVDNAKSKDLTADHNSRLKQAERPNITIQITKVKSRELKHDIKKDWGVEIMIDGTPIPVYFGSTAATMVYICTLLKQKMGLKLERAAFKKPLPAKGSFAKKDDEVIWLENVYHKLFIGNDEDFETWYPKMKVSSCHAINQGKSASNRAIKAHLFDFPNSIYYCSIRTLGKRNENSYFSLDIPAENIKVPEELNSLISGKLDTTIRTHALPHT